MLPGNEYNNTPIDNFMQTCKRNIVHGMKYNTREFKEQSKLELSRNFKQSSNLYENTRNSTIQSKTISPNKTLASNAESYNRAIQEEDSLDIKRKLDKLTVKLQKKQLLE